MNLSQLAGARHQELFWVLVVAAAATFAFRLARPAERRSLRVGWVLLALALGAHALVALSPDGAPLAQGAHAAALLRWRTGCT